MSSPGARFSKDEGARVMARFPAVRTCAGRDIPGAALFAAYH